MGCDENCAYAVADLYVLYVSELIPCLLSMSVGKHKKIPNSFLFVVGPNVPVLYLTSNRQTLNIHR